MNHSTINESIDMYHNHIRTPHHIPPLVCHDASSALVQVRFLYDLHIGHLRQAMHEFVGGNHNVDKNPDITAFDMPKIRAFYPMVRFQVAHFANLATINPKHLSYGFVAGTGCFETTLTRPDVLGSYYLEQFELLLQNHGGVLEVLVSDTPIPLHFSFAEGEHIEGTLSSERRALLREKFDLPDLNAMDDGIANGTAIQAPSQAKPLSLFTAPRVDYSLHRLRHYTGTLPHHVQPFILLTNYQFYIDEFIVFAKKAIADPNSGYVEFIQPQLGSNNHLPQMPAYHLVGKPSGGITMVNIGVGPANAKNITDHLAVLRPQAWLMLGHCAGLRNSQQLGDYVLAHGYIREDHVLDEELPLWIPIPALAEVQIALEAAVADVTELDGVALKRILRTGTVASTDNRNWELMPDQQPQRRFSQSRAVALDMESATLAGNGFRFRVPYGTLLCVSDKPLHGEIKLPGMANHFYRERIDQHLRIGIRAIELLRELGVAQLHSRKLRSFDEVAFR